MIQCYVVYAPVCQNQNQTNVFDGIREPSTTTSSGNNTQFQASVYSVHASGFTTTWCSRSSQPAPRSRPRDVCCCCWEVRQCYSVHSGVDSVRKSTAKIYFAIFKNKRVLFVVSVFFTWNLKKFIASELIFEKSEDNPLVFVPKTNWQKWPGKSPSWFWWCQRYSHQVRKILLLTRRSINLKFFTVAPPSSKKINEIPEFEL